jgi:hypothetical protein
MRLTYKPWRWQRFALAVLGTTFFLSGCDPTISSTVENGIITASNSLLTAWLQALITVIQQAATQTTA